MVERIIEKYGEEHQLDIAIEEMSELTKEICKYFRDPNKVKHYDAIKEELADVMIMAKQIQIIFEIPKEELKAEMDFKINRTIERMEHEDR